GPAAAGPGRHDSLREEERAGCAIADVRQAHAARADGTVWVDALSVLDTEHSLPPGTIREIGPVGVHVSTADAAAVIPADEAVQGGVHLVAHRSLIARTY